MKKILAIFSALLFVIALPVKAQGWFPQKPITVLVTFAPGGGTDILLRHMQNYAGNQGITVVVEYRSGADGLIAMQAASRRPPDGYSLLMANAANLSITTEDFDPLRSLRVITGLRSNPLFLVASNQSNITNFNDLVTMLRDPGYRISAGAGAPNHRMVMEDFLNRVGAIDAVVANYRGANPVMQDIMAGNIQIAFIPGAVVHRRIASGDLRLLATERSMPWLTQFGQVPNLQDTLEGYVQFDSPTVVATPLGVPQNVMAFWENWFREYVSSESFIRATREETSLTVPFGSEYVITHANRIREFAERSRRR